MILRYVVLCVHCTVINKLGLAGPEASPNCPLLSNNFLFKLYWTDRKNISPQLIPQTSVSLCCCHTILTAVVAVDSLTGLCCCCDFAVADSAAVAVRPEAEVGRDLLIIWCVGGGERERLQTVTLIHSQGQARLQYPGLSLVRVRVLQSSYWPDV